MAWDWDDIYWPHKRFARDKPQDPATPHLRQDAVYASIFMESNPGPADLRCTDDKGTVIGEQRIKATLTVNVAELVGVGLALRSAVRTGKRVVYTANKTVVGWMGKRSIGSCQKKKTAEQFLTAALDVIDRHRLSVRLWDRKKFGRHSPSYFEGRWKSPKRRKRRR